jgi:glucosamine kinase
VLRAAQAGDAVAAAILDEAARDVAAHVASLHARLGPWEGEVPVVLHGGVGGEPGFRARVAAALNQVSPDLALREPLGDALAGALRLARAASVPVS